MSIVRLDLLTGCIKHFYNENGYFPEGATREVLAQLMGDNPKKEQFLRWPANDLFEGAISIYGSPVDLSVSSKGHVYIKWAGKNAQFGDSDDKIYDYVLSKRQRPGEIYWHYEIGKDHRP